MSGPRPYNGTMNSRSEPVANLVIVGAGAAGLMAAIAAAEAGRQVVLCEQLDRVGARLSVTGGGRGNLTDLVPDEEFVAAFGREGRFVQPALAALDPPALRELLKRLGVPTVASDGRHVYPRSDRASDVTQALLRRCAELKVDVRVATAVQALLIEGGEATGVQTRQGPIRGAGVLIATGGRSYAELGGTGRGYELAIQAGHTIVPVVPALVPLLTAETWAASCAGVSVPARVWIDLPRPARSAARRAGAAGERQGDLLFTHHGVSGPAVLDLSGDVADLLRQHPSVPIRIDLAPGTSEADWLRRFEVWQQQSGVQLLRPLLGQHVPRSVAAMVCALGKADRALTAAHLPLAMRRRLAELLSGLPLTVTGTEGFERSMVTRGGVALGEVNPRTLESRKLTGLFFAGEVLNLDGPCGGYNLQWAFASGYLAGCGSH